MSDDSRKPNTVREAVQQYLRRMRREATEETVDTYRLDLRQFVLWCEDEGIERVDELTGYDFELYEDDRAKDLAPSSLENQMGLVQRFIRFCEHIDLVEEDLHEKVHVPYADKSEKSRDEKLTTEDAKKLIGFFRRSSKFYGTKWHAILEVAWHTGARVGGLRALDLSDYDADFNVLEFRHRPNQGTPLKKKLDGERDVGILSEVADVLDAYIAEHRHDRHDEYARAPLFTTRSKHGRISKNAVRGWLYQATQPCWYDDDPCPHDKRREDCEWTRQSSASVCPSSRSPHAIRTGAITFHQNRGFEASDTAARVNASPSTIQDHYDKAEQREEMEERRRPQLDKLSLDDDGEEQTNDSSENEADSDD